MNLISYIKTFINPQGDKDVGKNNLDKYTGLLFELKIGLKRQCYCN